MIVVYASVVLLTGCAEEGWHGIPIPPGFQAAEAESLTSEFQGDLEDSIQERLNLVEQTPAIRFQAFVSDSIGFAETWSFYEKLQDKGFCKRTPFEHVPGGMVMLFTGSNPNRVKGSGMLIIAGDIERTVILASFISREDIEKIPGLESLGI